MEVLEVCEKLTSFRKIRPLRNLSKAERKNSSGLLDKDQGKHKSTCSEICRRWVQEGSLFVDLWRNLSALFCSLRSFLLRLKKGSGKTKQTVEAIVDTSSCSFHSSLQTQKPLELIKALVKIISQSSSGSISSNCKKRNRFLLFQSQCLWKANIITSMHSTISSSVRKKTKKNPARKKTNESGPSYL